MSIIEGIRRRLKELEEFENKQPMWVRSFEMIDPAKENKYLLDEERECLIKLCKGKTTAMCILLKYLDKLPKEEGL